MVRCRTAELHADEETEIIYRSAVASSDHTRQLYVSMIQSKILLAHTMQQTA